jgi:hypothetical protein
MNSERGNTYKRNSAFQQQIDSYGVSCWSLADPSDPEMHWASLSWPGLTRPSTQRRRDLRIDSALCSIINYLIAGLGVLADGRVKPGHDGKPQGGMRSEQQQLTL